MEVECGELWLYFPFRFAACHAVIRRFLRTLSVFPFIYFGQRTEMLIKRTSLQQLDVLRFRSAFTWSFSAGWFQVY
jgi:hypothetical protein